MRAPATSWTRDSFIPYGAASPTDLHHAVAVLNEQLTCIQRWSRTLINMPDTTDRHLFSGRDELWRSTDGGHNVYAFERSEQDVPRQHIGAGVRARQVPEV